MKLVSNNDAGQCDTLVKTQGSGEPSTVASDGSNAQSRAASLLGFLPPGLVCLLGIALTLIAHQFVGNQQRAMDRSISDRMSKDLVSRFDKAVFAHGNLLAGIRGLYNASEHVTRLEFEDYLNSFNVAEQFPGATGISWIQLVHHDGVKAFEQSVESDRSLHSAGYPGFKIRPESDNPIRYVVKFRYPSEGMNRSLGFDLGSNQQRLFAIDAARDTGEMIATPPIKLVGQGQPGFLLLLPVYSKQGLVTVSQRREYFRGLVVGAFGISELMEIASDQIFSAVQVHDITDEKADGASNAFYSRGQVDDARLAGIRSLNVAGREWEFRAYLDPQALKKSNESAAVSLLYILGIALSIISAILIWTLATARNRAIALARRLTTDLTKANRNLRRSNNDLSQFAYIASHDLQTPVRNVDSTITLLEHAIGDNRSESVSKYLTYLRDSSTRMQKLVTDLLEFARTDNYQIQLAPTDLNQVVGSALSPLSQVIEQNTATINIDELPSVLGDADQLERVFVNLLGNAIKYRHSSRRIKIDIDSTSTDTHWHIRVKDNGMGIEVEHLDRVFQPFQRLHRHDEIEGTGLGLSICRQILENLGGSLAIECSSDEGTIFLMAFPHLHMSSLRSAA